MTDEIKQKISKTKKQNWSIEKQFNFGKVSYTNPDTLETKYFVEGTQPKNWIKGNKKLSEHVNNKGKNNPRSRPVYCVETSQEFWGIEEASKYYNISRSTLSRHIGKYWDKINCTLKFKE